MARGSRNNALDDLLARLEKEQEEIAEATRIIKRYASKGFSSEPAPIMKSIKRATRPPGLPTSAMMIEAVLADAGNKGLGIGALVKAIADRYWPGLITSQIAPTGL